jgi:serine/threonine protein kinase
MNNLKQSTKPPSIERNLIGIFTKFEPLQGHYGSIRKCMLRTGTSHKWIGWPLIAMKKIEIVKLNDNQVQVISKSICELLELRHEAFLRYYGIVMNRKNKISIVTDWLPEESVSLLSFHSKTDGLFTQWEETRSYSLLSLAKQICEGMAWVHDRGILHRNLTSTNVFLVPKQNIDARNISLGDRWNVKISDFGLKDLLIYENRVLEGELEKIPKTYKAVCWMVKTKTNIYFGFKCL